MIDHDRLFKEYFAECLRILATLRLDAAKTRLVSGFVDTYLRLSKAEEQLFAEEIGKLDVVEQERVMEIRTSWGEQAERSLILRQLKRRVGEVPEPLVERIEDLPIDQLEALGEELLDFSSVADLENWLAAWGIASTAL
jgi:hypothetical protein